MISLLFFMVVQFVMMPNGISQIASKSKLFNVTEQNPRQKRTFAEVMLGFLWMAQLFSKVTSYAPYGITPHAPWSYNRPIYPTYSPYTAKPTWYPIAGPYTYGPPPHPTPPQDHRSSLTQQIVHIHDSGLPDGSQVEHYEGNDYHIRNSVANLEYQDLAEVASSNVEVRKQKQKPKVAAPVASNRKRVKPRARKPNQPSRKSNQYGSQRRQSYSGKSGSETKKKLRRRVPERLQYPRRTRPTRRTHSRFPYYYDNEYFNGRVKHRNDYEDDVEYLDYSGEEGFPRRQQMYYDDTTEGAPTTEETNGIDSTAVPTTSATSTQETTTEGTTTNSGGTSGNGQNNNTSTQPPAHDFDFYGPSNGHENISITYGPPVANRHDLDIGNYWYIPQGGPNIFNYKDYLAQGGFIQ